MIIGGIFEIMWEEGKQTNGYFFVKIKLVPIGKHTLKDILAYYRKFECIGNHDEYMIKEFLKHRGQRYLELHLKNVGQYHNIKLDKKEGIAFHEAAGGHYITQHWSDVLVQDTKSFTHRCIVGAEGGTIKFITKHHGTVELDVRVIDHYFVSGFKGEMNDRCFGDVAKAMMEAVNK